MLALADEVTHPGDDASLKKEEARFATAMLSAQLAAGTLDETSYGGISGLTNHGSLESGCRLMADYADCALIGYSDLGCTVPKATPPPKGTEPEAFCEDTLNAFSSTPFVCSNSPLSNVMSQIVRGETGSSETMWLTVTPSGEPVAAIWWPIFLAAWAGDAPSLMLVQTSGTVPHAAILSIHEIAIEVRGPKTETDQFRAYLVDQMTTKSGVAAPDWSQIRIVLPNKLMYRSYPVDQAVSVLPPLRSWVPGQGLYLPDGTQTSSDWSLQKAVGIIDPCRPSGQEGAGALSSADCLVRAEGWYTTGRALLDNDAIDFFSETPTCQ